MKIIKLLAAIGFFPLLSSAQNIPQCDSLVINCCDFDTAGPNTLTIYVSNPSTVLFDYPGFALLDANLDTVAKETVNYFGIGVYPQMHTMDIVAPLNLPFAGYLDLYVLFYDTIACRFAFTIADTVTSVSPGLWEQQHVKVFPNPVMNEVNISVEGISSDHFNISLLDVAGREIRKVQSENSLTSFDLTGLASGIYFLRETDAANYLLGTQKLTVE